MLLGLDLIRAVDAHRKDNMQRRRIGRLTRSFDEYVAQELGVTLEEEHHAGEGQLRFPELDEVLGRPPVRSSPMPAPRAGAAA